ncbi:MAG: hypothetical protein ACREOE_00015 [Gemmatimonadales bacterium]
MRLNPEQRKANEHRIRAAADQLISGDIPPGGGCDVKTLARLAGVDRAAFYGTRPYAGLREDFERRLQKLHAGGRHADPKDAQIARLSNQLATLTERIAGRDATIAGLTAFKTAALSRLAAQHQEITRLRRAGTSNIRRLPERPAAPRS